MSISAAQCRAARALLDWTQWQLAENAQVARPTIADFERNMRTPIRNNLASIVSAFEAAGIAFIPENGEGAGVKFRKVELEYCRSVKVRGHDVVLLFKYRGKNLMAVVPREIIDDMDHTSYSTDEQRVRAVQNHLPKYLVAAENIINCSDPSAIEKIVFASTSFPAGTF